MRKVDLCLSLNFNSLLIVLPLMHPYLGSSSDAEEMLRQYSDGGDSSIRQLSSLVTVMKREYNQVIMAKHLTFSV